MEKVDISTHGDLKSLIALVRESKDRQEMELKESFKGFAHALSPVEVVKSSLEKLVNDKEVQFDLVKGGLNLGTSYLINAVFNRKSTVKGFIGSTVLGKLASTYIQANAGSIIVGITSMFKSKKEVD